MSQDKNKSVKKPVKKEKLNESVKREGKLQFFRENKKEIKKTRGTGPKKK